MSTLAEQKTKATREWMEQPRFKYITRLHSARQVVAQRGTIPIDYPVAREAATASPTGACGLIVTDPSMVGCALPTTLLSDSVLLT